MDDIDRQWEFLLEEHNDELIRQIATRASREPALRRLFPYVSMRNLRFSKVATTYPYDPMPYILTEVPGERYQVRDSDNRALMTGTLDDVVRELAHIVSRTD
jgi:hypothetical protein